jgi:predicted nucleotidyltransferase
MNLEMLKKDIVESLRPLAPEKVILFGSCAHGNPTPDSDIDLYVVSKEDYLPETYADNMQHYKKYSRVLRSLKERFPVDLIVHTLAMNKAFEASGSSFAKDIMAKGVRLI